MKITLFLLLLVAAVASAVAQTQAVMRPAGEPDKVILREGYTPLAVGPGPWGHETTFFSGADASATVSAMATQVMCGGGNGYSQFALVQGGQGLSLGMDPAGNANICFVSWPGFPAGEAQSVIQCPLRINLLADLAEQAEPANPPADTARVFARDDGTGKTQLCVIFPSGATQVLATEPSE